MRHVRYISIAPAMTEEEMAFQEVLFFRIAVLFGALLSRKLQAAAPAGDYQTMRHIKNVTVAKASTNTSGGIGVEFIIWLASIVGVLKNYG